ncbi:6739_t:CDS:1, partial [Funneliformis mosseae]
MSITLNCFIFGESNENNFFEVTVETNVTVNILKKTIKDVVNVNAKRLNKFNLWKVDIQDKKRLNINSSNLLNELDGEELPPFSKISEYFSDEMGRKHYIIVQRVKNIIVLCDGTWNGLSTKTNVYDLYQLLMKQGQQPWYRQGVGTKVSNIFFFLNGALALELDDIIMEAYKKIVEEYNEEINEFESKEIWLFGFSRGAYIVRCVAGMIRNCGILKFNNEGLIKRAYEIYR